MINKMFIGIDLDFKLIQNKCEHDFFIIISSESSI